MIAVGRAGIEKDYGWKDWSVCSTGDACFQVGVPSLAMIGTNAGTFYGIGAVGPGAGLPCFLFLYLDSKGWHYVNAGCSGPGSVPGAFDRVFVTGGCANYRSEPWLSSKVYGCLRNGTGVQINSAPVYRDGHIWWHLAAYEGWIAHDFLVAPKA